MMPLSKIPVGKTPTRADINALVERANILSKFNTGPGIVSTISPAGINLSGKPAAKNPPDLIVAGGSVVGGTPLLYRINGQGDTVWYKTMGGTWSIELARGDSELAPRGTIYCCTATVSQAGSLAAFFLTKRTPSGEVVCNTGNIFRWPSGLTHRTRLIALDSVGDIYVVGMYLTDPPRDGVIKYRDDGDAITELWGLGWNDDLFQEANAIVYDPGTDRLYIAHDNTVYDGNAFDVTCLETDGTIVWRCENTHIGSSTGAHSICVLNGYVYASIYGSAVSADDRIKRLDITDGTFVDVLQDIDIVYDLTTKGDYVLAASQRAHEGEGRYILWKIAYNDLTTTGIHGRKYIMSIEDLNTGVAVTADSAGYIRLLDGRPNHHAVNTLDAGLNIKWQRMITNFNLVCCREALT